MIGRDAPYGGVLLAPIRSRNVFEEALDRLAHAIKTGLYQPGDRLPSERDLAARLEISRPTIREVLRALEEGGYVELRRGRTGGAYVLSFSAEPSRALAKRIARSMGAVLIDALDFRWAIEPAAADLAARRADAHGIATLQLLQEECAAAVGRDYRACDVRFHTEVASLAACRSLATAVRDLQVRLTDLFAATPVVKDVLRHSDLQHLAILDAIQRGDAPAARSAMEEHLNGTQAFLRAFLD